MCVIVKAHAAIIGIFKLILRILIILPNTDKFRVHIII